MTIVQAEAKHLDDLAPLFDGYRVFYKQQSNVAAAKAFLKDRLTNKDSVIYMAYLDEKAVGFTQLYPLFSSVSMETMYLLNDLYIDSTLRSRGIGQLLIQAAKEFCITNNYKGLAIQTAQDNKAQELYERVGFVKDTDLHFFWENRER